MTVASGVHGSVQQQQQQAAGGEGGGGGNASVVALAIKTPFNTDKCADFAFGNARRPLILWDCHPGTAPNQEFFLDAAPPARIRTRHDLSLCLEHDVSPASAAAASAASNVRWAKCHDGNHQRWYFAMPGGAMPSPASPGVPFSLGDAAPLKTLHDGSSCLELDDPSVPRDTIAYPFVAMRMRPCAGGNAGGSAWGASGGAAGAAGDAAGGDGVAGGAAARSAHLRQRFFFESPALIAAHAAGVSSDAGSEPPSPPPPPSPSPPPLGVKNLYEKCWEPCNGQQGACHSFCGKHGACCRSGFLSDPVCAGHGCDGYHCCVAPVVTTPVRLGDTQCWEKCDHAGGVCRGFCGEGACCRQGFDNDPGCKGRGCDGHHCCDQISSE